jgi:hypothetical protein
MSERTSRACSGKKHYNSERRARDAAKESQIKFGIPMNEYPCPVCKGKWVVGSTYPWDAKTERRKRDAEIGPQK